MSALVRRLCPPPSSDRSRSRLDFSTLIRFYLPSSDFSGHYSDFARPRPRLPAFIRTFHFPALIQVPALFRYLQPSTDCALIVRFFFWSDFLPRCSAFHRPTSSLGVRFSLLWFFALGVRFSTVRFDPRRSVYPHVRFFPLRSVFPRLNFFPLRSVSIRTGGVGRSEEESCGGREGRG